MNKRMTFFAIMVITLIVPGQLIFADFNEDFAKELKKNNINGIERLLQRRAGQMDLTICLMTLFTSWGGGQYSLNTNYRNNTLAITQLLVRYGVDLNRGTTRYYFNGYRNRPQLQDSSTTTNYPLHYAVRRDFDISIIRYLLENGASPNIRNTNSVLGYAISKNNQNLVSILLNYGAQVNPQSDRGIFFITVNNGELQLAKVLLDNGVDINARESWFHNVDSSSPFISNGTILMLCAYRGDFDAVSFLIANGARVNLRDDNGSTAASLAYDMGEIEVYNYLKENGAIDFEPRQTVQPAVPAPAAPSSTTNVYVQPSAPAQSTPAPTIPTLQAGTYAASGTNHTMTLIRISDTSGTVNYYVGGGLTVGSGTYRISNNQLSLSFGPLSSNEGLRNKTFIYNITSSTSFSGSGEIWARR